MHMIQPFSSLTGFAVGLPPVTVITDTGTITVPKIISGQTSPAPNSNIRNVTASSSGIATATLLTTFAGDINAADIVITSTYTTNRQISKLLFSRVGTTVSQTVVGSSVVGVSPGTFTLSISGTDLVIQINQTVTDTVVHSITLTSYT